MALEQVNSRTLADCLVLIVDDQESSRLTLETLLQDIVECDSVDSGEAALSYCQAFTPDLILMDVCMPNLNGHETSKALQELPERKDIPIIFVTSSTTDEEQMQCWESGCVDFVTKPVNACTLQNRVKSQLNHKLKNDLLEQLIYVDKLTGAYNRHYLDDFLPPLINHSKRNAKPLSLVLFDIDHFKRFNDQYGHVEGDKCLRKISTSINHNLLRPMDKLIRIGGEEFLVILPDTDRLGANRVAKRLLDSLFNLRIPHEGSNYGRVTLSAGIVTKVPEIAKNIDYLMLQVDKNLYTAKRQGRNCIVDHVQDFELDKV